MVDSSKMVDFICRHIDGGYGEFVLATGIRPGDDIVAEVTVGDGYIDIQSNCREWGTVREVYDHLRWQAMPSWEQKKWIQLGSVVSKTTKIPAIAPTNIDPFRFQKVGNEWHIHFRSGDEIKTMRLANSDPLERMHKILGNEGRWVSSDSLVEMPSRNTEKMIRPVEAISVDVGFNESLKQEYAFKGLSVSGLEAAYDYLKSDVESSRLQGLQDKLLDAQSELSNFEKFVGKTQEDFKKLVFQKLELGSQKSANHGAVRKSVSRLLKTLEDKGMGECADFLQGNVQKEGQGFAYRPSSPAPEWVL